MNRRIFIKSVAVLLASAPFPCWPRGFADNENSRPDFPDDDSYAIWSLLIPLLRPNAKSYLVPSSTNVPNMVDGVSAAPVVPMPPIERAKLGMVIIMNVPPGDMNRFRSAAAAFRSDIHAPQTALLERKLTLPGPYKLMDQVAMEEYSRLKPPLCVADASHPWHRDRRLEKKYAGFASPCLFSRVYFDRDRSLGLVWAETNHGFTVFAFAKKNDGWQQLGWSASSMSIEC